jgi:RNA polymerase sigma factor (sigma-70 family)
MGIAQLLRVACAHDAEGHSDGLLLGQFLARRDEAAFTALVRRHGPMVLGVCRRVLGNDADAEDAFQATFLVLVRKAASLAGRAVLGDWLHGVARRAALNARKLAARRRAKEQMLARAEAQGDEVRNDWLPLLDEEVCRLPERYRLPIVLCDLEGRTRREAAARLGWPEGTVAGRLARARGMLAKRLARHGLALSAGSLAALWSQNAAPASLVESTVKAAPLLVSGPAAAGLISAKVAGLTEGVVKAMLLSKLETAMAAVLVMVGIVVLGYGVLVAGNLNGDSGAPEKPAPMNEEKAKPAAGDPDGGRADGKGGGKEKPARKAERPEQSPHAAALELVFQKAADRIRNVDRANWWHDTEERAWLVQRPFAPGTIDSTHLFTVSYRIGGKQVAAWQVDTRKRTVEEIVVERGKR